MNEAEKKAVLISQLPYILKKENVVVIAGSDEMMEACVQIGNAKALIAENDKLQNENENLRNEIAALSDRVDELSDEVGGLPEQGVPKRIMMLATMMQALLAAAMDDNKADTILHQVWAYQYLLDELHEELKDK